MSNVLQTWVTEIPWKCQSILLSGFRGPDTGSHPAIKAVGRWIRTMSQNNADPAKDYMRKDLLPDAIKLCDELEWLSCHFVHHFADALRILGIWHPDENVRHQAAQYHYRIAEEIFHFAPEEDRVFIHRHRDKVEHE